MPVTGARFNRCAAVSCLANALRRGAMSADRGLCLPFPGLSLGGRERCDVAEYPLKTLLDLRRREEDVAKEAWVKALGAQEQAEAEATRLASRAGGIAERLAAAREAHLATLPTSFSAAEAATAVRFRARLCDELARATALHETHRRGPLARACAQEECARQELVERRLAREALETHEEQFREDRRREADQRADEDNDEHARFARHERQSRPGHDPEA